MFELNVEKQLLTVALPEGKTGLELVKQAKREIREIAPHLRGMSLSLTGDLTRAIALILGSELSGICKSIALYDPEAAGYIVCIG